MSSLANPRVRRTRPANSKTHKRLRIVAAPKSQASRTPFVAVVIALLSVGLVGLIFMSTMLQAQAFTIAELNKEATSLETAQQSLTHDLERMQSPQGMAAAALNLGMVPNTNPVFLRLSDGKVIGKPEPAAAETNVLRVGQ